MMRIFAIIILTTSLSSAAVHNVTQGTSYTTIQEAINAANAGDVINVDAGTYVENITVNKRLSIIGAGISQTIVTASTGGVPTITVSGSGSSANDRLVIRDMKVTGATGLINVGSGILVQSTSAQSNLTFESVDASSNGGPGIAFNGTPSVSDVVIKKSNLSSNANAGIRIASAVPSFNGLLVDSCTINNNASIAFSYNPDGNVSNTGTNFTISNTTFNNNSTAGVTNAHDLSFFAFRGNATLSNVTVTSGNGSTQNSNSYGISIDGGTGNGPLGTVSLNNVTVQGHVGKGALLFQRYTEISGVTMSNVDVSNCVAPWGQLILSHTDADAFQVGNTTLKSLAIWTTGGANAASAQFKHISTGAALDRSSLADCFQIENQIVHKIDVATLGFARAKTGEVFVTSTSFASPTTTTPSIQRGVDAATAGDVVNVSAGTFTENVTVAKRLSIIGAGSSLGGTVVQGVGGLGDVFTYTTGSGISGTPASLEKIYLTGGAKGVYLGTNDYINLDDLDLVGLSSYGVELINNNNINITNSVFTSGTSGIRLGTTASANTLLINGCTFSNNSEQAIHAFASASGGLNNVTITNNTITDCGVTNNMSAMYFEKLSNASISNNTITNTGISTNPRGIVLNMKTTAYSNVTIASNIITENRTAVANINAGYAIRFAGFSGGSLSTINVLANSIDGYKTGVEYGAAVDRSTIQIKNNLVNNVQLGVLSYSGTSSSSTQINDNSFTNLVTGAIQTPIPSPFAILNADAAGTAVSATCNWYGSIVSGVIAAKIYGQVTYSPWLVNGTDNDLVTMGFQPVSGSCTGTQVTVTLNAQTNVSCYSGANGDITITPNGGDGSYSYLWTGPNSYTSTLEDPTGLIAGNYTVVVTDGNGSTATTSVTITQPAAPTVDAGSNQTICADATATLGGTIGGSAASAVWSTAGTGAFDNASSLTAVYTPSVADIAAGSVVLTLTTTDPDGNGPCTTANSSITITINSIATVDVGADQTICGTASVTLAGSLVNSTAGSWSTSGTGTFSPSATAANATYIPSNADRTAGTVTLTFCTTDAVSPCVDVCDAIDIFFIDILAGPGPITGSLQLCNPTPSAPYTLSVTPAPSATSYTWTVPSGVTIVAGQGTTTLFVSFSSNSIQNGVVGAVSVQADNTNACGVSAPSTAFISVQLAAPVTPGSISGPLKVCPGDAPSTFSVASVARAGLYTWTVPTGATIVSGQGTQIVSVAFGAGFVGGNMSVVASNGCGASSVRNRTVFVNTLPAPAGISGFVNGICGAVGAVYAITAPVTGALSYQWSVPANVAITSNTGNSITVNFLPGFTSGNISVVAVNNCGNSVARTITVNGYPGTPGAISGAIPACLGAINMFSIASVTGASNYNWLVSNGNSLQIQPSSSLGIGQGQKNIEIKTNAAGTIAVNASNSCGTGRNQNLTVTTAVCPRIGDATAGLNLMAYPNPTSDVLNVAFTSEKDEYYTLRLLDVTGRVVMTDAKVATEGQNQAVVMVKGFASGIYSLQFQMNDKSETLRVFVD